jgi:hypothetical protein
LFCTLTDACSNGDCVGTGDPCSDVSSCTVDECFEGAETYSCSDVPLPDDTPCDDQNACTVNDLCSNGDCAGGQSALGSLCVWTIAMRDAPKVDVIKTKNQVVIDGEVCGGVVRLGLLTSIGKDVIAAEPGDKAMRLAPTALVGEDIVTAGGGARGVPGTAKLPYTSPEVSSLAPGSLTAKSDATGFYDLTGTHDLVAPCVATRGGFDAIAAALDSLAATSSIEKIKLPRGGSTTIEPTVVGGLNVIDVGSIKAAKESSIELSGGGDANTVMVLRVAGKMLVGLRSLVPESVASFRSPRRALPTNRSPWP